MSTILFCGGGSMGPVAPLLAVLRQMRVRDPHLKFVWAGTAEGPEREVIEQEHVPFYPVTVAKIARYLTLDWLRWPGRYLRATSEAKRILESTHPSLVVSVGGFTAVPIMKLAAKKGIPCAIHQLDAEPGLSNRVVAKLCKDVTTSFAYDEAPFRNVKSEQVPTPCRFVGAEIPLRDGALGYFGFTDRPTIFVTGGGTGAQALNEAVWMILDELLKFANVIHTTGKGKGDNIKKQGYFSQEFFPEEDMRYAYSLADIVISRAGIGGLSEISALQKCAIVVPMPGSHQEENAKKVSDLVIHQGARFENRVLDAVQMLLQHEEIRQRLITFTVKALPTDDGSTLAERWMKLLDTTT